MASSRGTALSIARSSPSTSSTSAPRLRPSCHVGSMVPPHPGGSGAAGRTLHDSANRPRFRPIDAILPAQDQNGGAGMTTGAKIAIGCGIAVVVAGIAAVVTIGMGAYWIKGKVEQTAGDLTKRSQEMETYQKQANANPFTRPADGVIQEPRLLKFLEVRKGVHSVYEMHRAEVDGMKDKKEPSLSDVVTVGGILLEARIALVTSLAAVGMSEEEYHFIVQQVYQSAWASAAQKEGGQQPADVMDQGLKAYRDQTRAGL